MNLSFIRSLSLTGLSLSGLFLLANFSRADDAWQSLHNGGNTSTELERLPVKWSPESGVAWSVELPGYGQSAPVIWGGHVYITAIKGDEKEICFVQAYEVTTGKRTWEYRFAASIRAKNSYMVSRAAPTPVVDQDGVYAFFESGDLHALTHDGKKRWSVELFDEGDRRFNNAHGYGASPTQTSEAVIVAVDHRGPSYLLALSKRDGHTMWKTERSPRSSWTSPQVTRVAGSEQVVISSGGTVDGYDAQTGRLKWSHTGLTGNVIPSVTVQGDRVFVGADLDRRQKDADSTPASNCCIRIDSDFKDGYEILWKAKKAVSHYASPLSHHERVYYVNRVGVVVCLDGKTGEQLFSERTSGACWAQPIAAGDCLYLFHKDGQTTVLKATDQFEIVAKNRLWRSDNPPLPSRSYDFDPPTETDPRPRKPQRDYMDPLVYGVAAIDGTFIVRIGTALYQISNR